MFYAFYIVVESVIMYTYFFVPTYVCALNILSGWICAQYKCSYYYYYYYY